MTARCDKMPQMQSSPLLAHPGMLRHRICRSVDLEIASEEKKTLRTPNHGVVMLAHITDTFFSQQKED